LTPYQGSGIEIKVEGICDLGIMAIWIIRDNDGEAVEPFNSPRCNLGKNINDIKDDNPKATVPMSAAISGGLNLLEMELQIPKICSRPFGVVGIVSSFNFPRVAPAAIEKFDPIRGREFEPSMGKIGH
jgi:hypothetical protein